MRKRSLLGMRGRRARGEGGAAVLEFALVGTVLMLLLVGICTFGLLLQRKQQDVQSAAEGARAAVSVPYSFSVTDPAYVLGVGGAEPASVAAARAAVNRSMTSTGRTCSQGDSDSTEAGTIDGLRCPITLTTCLLGSTYTATDALNGARPCIKVVVIDENGQPASFAPKLPLLSVFTPDRLKATSVAELGNQVGGIRS